MFINTSESNAWENDLPFWDFVPQVPIWYFDKGNCSEEKDPTVAPLQQGG